MAPLKTDWRFVAGVVWWPILRGGLIGLLVGYLISRLPAQWALIVTAAVMLFLWVGYFRLEREYKRKSLERQARMRDLEELIRSLDAVRVRKR